ncbi:MAG TPA: acyltransferase [Gemmatimonadales bacterium]|nr:acyltransferase [Gemmatimonadales bacterium]
MPEFDKSKSIRGILGDPRGSAFRTYRRLTVGNIGLPGFLACEILMSSLGPLPGALGLVLRRRCYRRLFGRFGKGVIIGRNCTFRHPRRIHLGDGVVIDDNCLIDARGAEDKGIVLGAGVMLNRNASLQSKQGDIVIGDRVSIGANSQFVSWAGIEIGADAAVAGGCYISAGSYDPADMGRPIAERKPSTAGPVVIGENAWLATRVTVLDAVTIGAGTIVSAGSVVSRSLEPMVVAHGNPAKVVFRAR